MVVCVCYKQDYDFGQTPEFGNIELGCNVRYETMVALWSATAASSPCQQDRSTAALDSE